MKIFTFFIVISIFYFLFSFSAPIVNAAGLVPCGGTGEPACNFCHLLTLVERIIDFSLYKIAIPLVVIFVIYGGFVIMTAGSSADKVKKGEDIIKAAVIGILIALLAWMLIATILKIVATGDGMPQNWWNPRAELKC